MSNPHVAAVEQSLVSVLRRTDYIGTVDALARLYGSSVASVGGALRNLAGRGQIAISEHKGRMTIRLTIIGRRAHAS